MNWVRVATGLVVSFLVFVCAAEAGQTASAGPAPAVATAESLELPVGFQGPPPPILPETISRDSAGRATIRALRLTEPIRLDGRLDEAIYEAVHAVTDFTQTDPQPGTLATEKTEAWIFFDRDQIYISARCWESQPERIVADVLQRDSTRMIQNESFSFLFDTFLDRRNGVMFMVNPLGSREEGQVTNEGQFNRDWNPIWNVRVSRFDGGWTVEAAVPFKSLRYGPSHAQSWGLIVRRIDRWKNEVSHVPPILNAPASSAIFRVSQGATLVGLEVPGQATNLEIKRYAISSLSTDLTAPKRISNKVEGDRGIDAKYSITQNLTSDFTYNTDFAQVEADEQQINLTRFSLFFPEKRGFFLENQGLFVFGGAVTGTDTPILFYSRRIGVNGSREVPIDVGGRLTGRIGRYSVGALNIETDDEASSGARATNFSVLRLKRDVLRRSNIGLLLTRRSVGQNAPGVNAAYGVDATFGFFDNLAINTYWARSNNAGGSADDAASYRAQLDYNGDRYGVQVERLVVGSRFNPEVGFVRRADMRRTFGSLRFSPRPRITSIRKFTWTGSLAYLENGTGRVDLRDWDGQFSIDFQNSDRFILGYSDTYEFIPAPFRIATGVVLPVAGYHYESARAGFNFGQQRKLSGNVLAEYGAFYDGHRTAMDVSQGRVNITAQVSVEPTYTVNWIHLVEGTFTTQRAGPRVTYTMTPLMFASALLQYSSDTHALTANMRLRWEYRPGSELFVVYNEQRDTLARGFPAIATRAVIVKLNYLLRF